MDSTVKVSERGIMESFVSSVGLIYALVEGGLARPSPVNTLRGVPLKLGLGGGVQLSRKLSPWTTKLVPCLGD